MGEKFKTTVVHEIGHVLGLGHTLVSCTSHNGITDMQSAEERIFVEEFGSIEPMGFAIADLNTIESIAEISTQAILCRVDECVSVQQTDLDY